MGLFGRKKKVPIEVLSRDMAAIILEGTDVDSVREMFADISPGMKVDEDVS